MSYNRETLIPYIPASQYDAVANDFLEIYFPDALHHPTPVPIEAIAKDEIGLDVQYVFLSEEQDIFGMTLFEDCNVEIYNPVEGLYNEQFFKRKTILIDPEAVRLTNVGCKNNTLAHECVHWYKHRMYFLMQRYTAVRKAKYCKCRVDRIPFSTEDETIMEVQATGIAPRILMPKNTFTEAALNLGITYGQDNRKAVHQLADFFGVSKQSVKIRLKECSLL